MAADVLPHGLPFASFPRLKVTSGEDTSSCAQFPLSPEPITIRIFSEQIGLLAVEQLLIRMRHPELRPFTCSVKPQLQIPG
jgi:DNA-binding LacI/PurR family transcriptional regulator